MPSLHEILSASEKTATVAATSAVAVEHYFHNREYWFGKRTDQSGNMWGELYSLTPYRVISATNDFGLATKIIGSGDTPVNAGAINYVLGRIQVTDAQAAKLYIIRVIWCFTGQTPLIADAAGQYTNIPILQPTGLGQSKLLQLLSKPVPVGTECWIKLKSSGIYWLDFLVGIHEYPNNC